MKRPFIIAQIRILPFVFRVKTVILWIILVNSFFMQKNTVLLVFGVIVVLVGGYYFMTKGSVNDKAAVPPQVVTSQPVPPHPVEVPPAVTPPSPATVSTLKEFTMNAYYDAQGKWFSLKEMTVKKGDKVRINITNIKGMHNFNIDELGIKKDLPLNDKVVIEFTADKAGDFVYYCAMPGHRAGGQWGTLHVTE